MAVIDIREEEQKVTKIIFASPYSEVAYVELCDTNNGVISIIDNGAGIAEIFVKDIPNLIKALQKANELWGKND